MKIVMILKNDLLVLPFSRLQEKQCFLCVIKCGKEKKGTCSIFDMCTPWLGAAFLMHVQLHKGHFLLPVVTDRDTCVRIWP